MIAPRCDLGSHVRDSDSHSGASAAPQVLIAPHLDLSHARTFAPPRLDLGSHAAVTVSTVRPREKEPYFARSRDFSPGAFSEVA